MNIPLTIDPPRRRWLTPEMEQLIEVAKAWPDNKTVYEAMKRLTDLLPSDDGEPMESPWHVGGISLLMELLSYHWRDRSDFYVGGNMFIYYSFQQLHTEDFKGPDFFLVEGVERHRYREKWTVWAEGGKYPNVIVEFSSPSTEKNDRTTKKDIYEQIFQTQDYFIYDPLTGVLRGWTIREGVYHPLVPNERGWLWSERLQLWLGTWQGEYHGIQGTWLRLYDKEGQLVPLPAEAEWQRAEQLAAEVARLRARLTELEQSGNGADS